MKKKRQNGKRRKHEAKPESATGPEDKSAGAGPGEPEFDEGIVEHVRMVTGLIEGREVSREEVVEMLKRTMRQPSLVREKRIDYILRSLREKPP